MRIQHTITVSSKSAPSSWELAFVLKRLIVAAGGVAEVQNNGEVQVIATCDPEYLRNELESAIKEWQ